MSWPGPPGGERRRVKVTPSTVAATLAEGIIQSTNRLRSRLDEEGFARAEPKRYHSEDGVLECLLFEWFLREIVVAVEFGRHAKTISAALQRRLLNDLERSGLSPAVLVNFDGVHARRFTEYGDAVEINESLQALGDLAWRRILGREEPSDRMTMLLAVRATAQLTAMRGIAQRYTLFTGT